MVTAIAVLLPPMNRVRALIRLVSSVQAVAGVFVRRNAWKAYLMLTPGVYSVSGSLLKCVYVVTPLRFMQ